MDHGRSLQPRVSVPWKLVLKRLISRKDAKPAKNDFLLYVLTLHAIGALVICQTAVRPPTCRTMREPCGEWNAPRWSIT
jgi:hypothetical protein